jgi:hypothetical protein
MRESACRSRGSVRGMADVSLLLRGKLRKECGKLEVIEGDRLPILHGGGYWGVCLSKI